MCVFWDEQKEEEEKFLVCAQFEGWPAQKVLLLCVCMMRKQTSLHSLSPSFEDFENKSRRPRCLFVSCLALFKWSVPKELFIHKKNFIMFAFPFKVSPLRKFSSCGIQLSTFSPWKGSKDGRPWRRLSVISNKMCGFVNRMVWLITSRKEKILWVILKNEWMIKN